MSKGIVNPDRTVNEGSIQIEKDSFAFIAADMALAGIESKIPVDEVIDAMYQVGASMPTAFS